LCREKPGREPQGQFPAPLAVLLIKGSIAGLDLKEFFLLLLSTGLAYRRCELARIDGEQIGAQKASIECLGDSTPAVHRGTNTVGKIRASSILTKSKEPLTGIIELRTDGGPIELAIDEDAALALRTDLERFLTR
jgi:hypothetical protein